MSTNPYKTITLDAAEKRSMIPLAGPYAPDEYHLMTRVVDQLTKDGSRIAYAYVNEDDARPDEITVFRKTSGG